MCVTPIELPNGQTRACRKCWQCRGNYVRQWVGRALAESQHCVGSDFVTLTYGGGDTPESQVLTPSHIQKYLRTVRDAGYPLRFFCAGEYGSAKGRAHWHLMIWWQDRVPELRRNWSHNMPWWDYGFSEYEPGSEYTTNYVMKYVQKDFLDGESRTYHTMSKNPMLGYRYFDELARDHVMQGLAPQTRLYKLPKVFDHKTGKPIEYYMGPVVWEYFCQRYYAWFEELCPGQKHRPNSPILDEYDDLLARRDYSDLTLQYRKPGKTVARPHICPRTGIRYTVHDTQAQLGFDVGLNSWFYPPEAKRGEGRLYWSYDQHGERSWQREIVTETKAAALKAASDIRSEFGWQTPTGFPERTR